MTPCRIDPDALDGVLFPRGDAPVAGPLPLPDAAAEGPRIPRAAWFGVAAVALLALVTGVVGVSAVLWFPPPASPVASEAPAAPVAGSVPERVVVTSAPEAPPAMVVEEAPPAGVPEQIAPLRFRFGGARPIVTDADAFAAVARALAACPGETVITGHACSVGDVAANERLGRDRAKAVRDVLAQAGVPASRMTVRSAGSLSPIASNANPGGRAMNRRVTLSCATR